MKKLTKLYYIKGRPAIRLLIILGRFLFTAFFICAFIAAFISISTYFYFARELTGTTRIMNSSNTGLVLLDKNNQPFFTFYQARYKNPVSLPEIPLVLRQTVVASEDKQFYSHPGFSPKSIVAALYVNLTRGELSFGGSTITQQLVKNSLLKPNKSFLRKYQELVLAQEVERRFSKDEILEMYLNSVYFGEGAFGVAQASLTYFGKDVRDLDLAESSLLIALLPAPSKYSPLSGNLEAAKQEQNKVLGKMVRSGYISEEQKEEAQKQELNFKPAPEGINSQAVHFALMVKDELIKKYGEEKIIRSGFKVHTSLNLDWQNFTQEQIKQHVARLAANRATNAAAVVLNARTGEINALVGSIDWNNEIFGRVNMATSPRQVGSSFKPVVYAQGFEKGLITPATVLQDRPTTFGGNYKPKNYDGTFRGPVLVRRALANSLNVPSVEVMNKVGVPQTLEMAKNLGITTLNEENNYGLSLVLGSGEVPLLEITQAYAVFANSGKRINPTSILKIENKYGETIDEHNIQEEQVISEESAFLITSILSDTQTRAEIFGNALNISRTAAVKTGTSEDFRDSLTIGYTPNLTIGVWVGNNDNTPMDNVAGSLGAAPIWRNLMEQFLKDSPAETFIPPVNIIEANICRSNGLLLKEASSAGYLEYFIKGTEPASTCFIPATAPPNPLPASTPPTNPSPAAPSLPASSPAPLPIPTPSQPVLPPGNINPIKTDKGQIHTPPDPNSLGANFSQSSRKHLKNITRDH